MQSGDPNHESVHLLGRATTGDRAAVEALLVRHLDDVRAFVRLRVDPALRARESASDLVQSVCRDVLARASKVEVRCEQSFRNWLYGAVLNKVRDKRRFHLAQRRNVEREEAATVDGLCQSYAGLMSPSANATAKEEVARIEAAFDELPEHYREVITLARIARLSPSEIAKATGKTDKAVRALLSRALVRLSTILARP